jgi:hypothetical protein
VVHLVHKDGAWSGTMDSLDQGANGIPFTSVTVEGAKLHFEIKSINGFYDGSMSEDGELIKGTWSQGGASLTLDLKRGDASTMPAPKRPQEPKAPFPYRSDVPVPGGGITWPEPRCPKARAVRGGGTGQLGPQDRNESVFGHKPFSSRRSFD